MKIQNLARFGSPEHEVVATFGGAQLIRNLDGRYELVGGTVDDCAAATEWIAMFTHGIAFAPTRAPLPDCREPEQTPAANVQSVR